MRSPKFTHSILFLFILIVMIATVLVSWPARQRAARRTPSNAVVESALAPVAVTFTVNTSSDLPDSSIGDGHCDTDGNLVNGDQCTLRAAVQEGASSNQGHSINFNLPAGSVITLNTSLPFFIQNVSIIGPGSNQLTIQRSSAAGTPNFTIFSFAPINGNFNNSISGLTITNGSNPNSGNTFPQGGCLFNMSPVVTSITDVTFRSCTGTIGGAVNNGGTLTVTSVTATGNTSANGAGIYNSGSLTVTNSTFSGNNAANGAGGGIDNAGSSATANVSNSTISNNSCDAQGAGIVNSGSGTFNLTNSTISGNNARGTLTPGEGGAANMSGTMTLTNVTVTANSANHNGTGGIANGGTVNLSNTIVANNTGGTSGFADLSGTFNSQGFNFVGKSASNGLTNGVNHDQVGSYGLPIDPLLGPLADNGGPTLTHALLVGSTAIDAGNTSQTTDQRGQARPIDDPNVTNAGGGNAADIGAFETNTFQVNTLVDGDDGACTAMGTGNGCTLREAINAANAATFAEVSFASALTSGGPATISLSTVLPSISSNVIIEGPGASALTVMRSSAGGTPNFRIFAIGSAKVVTISGLTIANGNLGGIFNDAGTLTVEKCVVTGHSGGAAIKNSSVNGGSTTINYSTITNNTAGGIDNSVNTGSAAPPAALTINNSTISGNSSSGLFAGIENAVGAGGTATMTINNSTISGNTTSNNSGVGGIFNFVTLGGTATLAVNNSTIYGNNFNGASGTGGVYQHTDCGPNPGPGCVSTIKLRNTIVAGNLLSGSTPSDVSGAVDSSSSFNLIGTGGSGGLSNGTNNNQVGVANPGLGPLVNNGGPTQTHALLQGSPAIDAGDNCVVNNSCSPALASALTTDQRGSGFNRSADGNGDGTARVDVGAYEVQSILVTNTADSGAGSLRQAIIDTNANPDANVISFQSGLTGTITLLSALPDLSSSMSINGPGANLLTVSRSNAGGTPQFRVIAIQSGKTVTISKLTITNGRTPDGISNNGAGILNEGALTIIGVAISGNVTGAGGFAANGGGGIYNSASLNIINSTISGNTTGNGSSSNSGGYGGGIYNAAGATMSLTNSTVSGNTTGNGTTGPGGEGGGIYNAGSLTLTNSTVSQNHTGTGFTGGSGGGINGSASLSNSIVANNTVPSDARGPDFYGSCDSQDYNLIANTSGMIFLHTRAHDITDVNALLGPLANNGGPTMTHALLPGSPAINAGSNTNLVADTADLDGDGNTAEAIPFDQRGFARVGLGTVDVGAFESRGFSIAAAGGTPQSAPITSTFASPLSATVSSAFGEPVSGGAVIFTPPATGPSGSFASGESLGVMVLLNGSGVATTPAFTANGIVGSYSVAASGSGISGTANFSLTNSPAPTTTSVSSSANPVNFPQPLTLTATVSSAAGTPTGSVSFADGSNSLGSAQLNNGVAQLSNPQVSAGTRTITAVYSGDGNFASSTGSLLGGQVVVPNLLMNPASITEGDSGTKSMTFSVNNGLVSNQTITVDYAIADGTATAGSDYVATSGTLSFAPGEMTKTVSVTINGDQKFEADETLLLKLSNPINCWLNNTQTTGTILNDDAQGGIVSFAQPGYTVFEGDGAVTIAVNRTGETGFAAMVNYATDDTGSPGPCADFNGLASSKCDFTTAFGTLAFAPNETQKTITVLVNRDSYISEVPSDAFTVKLSNLTGGAVFGTNSTATVKIMESGSPGANAIDDSSIFVRQHYHDFLNREADAPGLQFWTNEIESCGTDAACREVKRINVSGAFFLSIEFQQTGYLIERLYKTAYGDATGNSTFPSAHTLPVPMVRFSEFLADTQEIGRGVVVGQPGWEQQIENNKVAFINLFVQRSRFTSALGAMGNTQFVDKLNANAGNPLNQVERDQLIADLNASAKTRAQVLRAIAEHPSLVANEFNRAFVLMQFFGYLRRNPDDPQDHDHTGYDFWLTKLNQFSGSFQNAEMVKAFISSDEYRHRFGP